MSAIEFHAWIADFGQLVVMFGVLYGAWRSYRNGKGIAVITTATDGMQSRLEEAARAQERLIASESAAPNIHAAEARGRLVGADEEADRINKPEQKIVVDRWKFWR
jgi:hypothetical protein